MGQDNGSSISPQTPDMATLAQIILIVTCAYLADCRLRGKLHKHVSSLIEHQRSHEANKNIDHDHKTTEIKTNTDDHLVVPDVKTVKDADAIVFPGNDDAEVYHEKNKIVHNTLITMNISEHANDALSTSNVENEHVAIHLITKVVPATEAKEVFTNLTVLQDAEDIVFKTIDDKEEIPSNPIQESAEGKVVIDTNSNQETNINLDNIKKYETNNSSSNLNETVPDFSSRFGVTGNYMLVPVNNIQTQTYSNGLPASNLQVAPQMYVANNDNNHITSLRVANVGANPQYVTASAYVETNIGSKPQYATHPANVGSNIVANAQPQYATQTANVGSNAATNPQIPYATPNANTISNVGANPQYIAPNTIVQTPVYPSNINTPNVNYNGNIQSNTNYVPVNVPNTYVINGQLYAAVTVPNNVNAPNSLYFVNPQVSGSQVANNLPLYKLVSVGGQVGNQVRQTM